MDTPQHKEPSDILLELMNSENLIIQAIIELFSEPPIVGELTGEVLEKNEIRLCIQNESGRMVKWVEQRGERIGPKLVIMNKTIDLVSNGDT